MRILRNPTELRARPGLVDIPDARVGPQVSKEGVMPVLESCPGPNRARQAGIILEYDRNQAVAIA